VFLIPKSLCACIARDVTRRRVRVASRELRYVASQQAAGG